MAAALIIVAFAVFVIATVVQIRLAYRIKAALVDRHPEVWRRLTGGSPFEQTSITQFVRRRMDLELHDQALSRIVEKRRIAGLVSMGAWIAMLAGLALGYVIGAG